VSLSGTLPIPFICLFHEGQYGPGACGAGRNQPARLNQELQTPEAFTSLSGKMTQGPHSLAVASLLNWHPEQIRLASVDSWVYINDFAAE
jgi:hypothetical protein